MENKTTTELIELISKLDKQADKDPNGSIDWDTYGNALSELREREPFRGIFGESNDPNDPTLQERIADLEAVVKELKRHKHDPLTGDVLIRI